LAIAMIPSGGFGASRQLAENASEFQGIENGTHSSLVRGGRR